ncbi:MAG: T9SS type A sorting domain-containing protein [bacterium]
MKYLLLFMMICYSGMNTFSQQTESLNEFPIKTFHRVIENESTNRIIYQRLDGSVFEKYVGEMKFVELIPSDNNEFSILTNDLPNQSRNQIVYTRLNGESYMTNDMMVWFKNFREKSMLDQVQSVVKSTPNSELKEISLFPNPSNNTITVAFILASSQNIKMSIVSSIGTRKIIIDNENYGKGEYTLSIELSEFPIGEYNLVYQYGLKFEIIKFFIVR